MKHQKVFVSKSVQVKAVKSSLKAMAEVPKNFTGAHVVSPSDPFRFSNQPRASLRKETKNGPDSISSHNSDTHFLQLAVCRQR
jgi:hypothetical protein